MERRQKEERRGEERQEQERGMPGVFVLQRCTQLNEISLAGKNATLGNSGHMKIG